MCTNGQPNNTDGVFAPYNEGKTVVWIDCGLHSTEMAHGQMTPLLAHRVATEESAEMQQIRDNVIFLLMPVK